MKKILLVVIGTLSLVLGVVGIFLPLLPTTPLILLSLTCYCRSNKRFYDFIVGNKYLAPYTKDYLSGKGIPVSAKKKAILMIWLTIGSSVLFLVDKNIVKVILLMIATGVSIYIWTRRTPEPFSENNCDV